MKTQGEGRMKKNALLLLACIGIISTAAQAATPTSDCTSHVFVPRNKTTDLVLIDAITLQKRWEGWHDPEQRHRFLFYATPFYERSKKNPNMGSAFLLNNQSNTITVAQISTPAEPANVNSAWLGLKTVGTVNGTAVVFTSTFSIDPQSKTVGTHLYAYANLDDWFCGLWFDFAAAIVKRRNTLNCSEIVANYSNEFPGIFTVSQALANPAYNFGKFYCGGCCGGEQWRTAIDDIQFRLGWDTSLGFCGCEENGIAGIYIIGTVPTGRKNTGEFIFEPQVGSKHGSVGVGFEGEYNFDICDNNLAILTDFNYRYVFSHNECRSFDLTNNGPMSRYLLVQTELVPTQTLDGINFFTQCVKVTPQSTVQWWIALNYEWCDWNFEVGYDLFWRQQEKISQSSLDNITFTPAIGIFNPTCATLETGCSTVSTATIGTFVFVPDAGTVPTYVTITGANLNAASAIGGKVLTNKVYGAVATSGCFCDCASWTAAVGGSYEFVSSKYLCSALEYWSVFGKVGLNF